MYSVYSSFGGGINSVQLYKRFAFIGAKRLSTTTTTTWGLADRDMPGYPNHVQLMILSRRTIDCVSGCFLCKSVFMSMAQSGSSRLCLSFCKVMSICSARGAVVRASSQGLCHVSAAGGSRQRTVTSKRDQMTPRPVTMGNACLQH